MYLSLTWETGENGRCVFTGTPQFFSPLHCFARRHLLLSYFVGSAPSAPLAPVAHLPSRSQILGCHLSSLVFSENGCQMRKPFHVQLLRHWHRLGVSF